MLTKDIIIPITIVINDTKDFWENQIWSLSFLSFVRKITFRLDMCRRKTRNGECNRGTAGFAYVGGACVVNKRLEKVNSVAIVEDTGGFSGIIVAAHELGHL